MPAVHVLGSFRSSHSGAASTASYQASADVRANGIGIQRALIDNFITHDSSPAHEGAPTPGSSTVRVNGSPVALVGDSVVGCASTCIGPGSPDVFAGT